MGYKVTGKNHCKYPFCPWSEENKKQKCGENCAREQGGRSRALLFCTHPKCQCGYHGLCYSYAHGLL